MEKKDLLHAYLTSEEKYAPGKVIIQEGSMGDWIYLILEGHVKITKQTSSGAVLMGSLKKGAIFGEVSLLGSMNTPRNASVIAGDIPVRVGLLDGRQMRRDYESLSPELRLLFKAIAKRLQKANNKVAALVVALNQTKNMGNQENHGKSSHNENS